MEKYKKTKKSQIIIKIILILIILTFVRFMDNPIILERKYDGKTKGYCYDTTVDLAGGGDYDVDFYKGHYEYEVNGDRYTITSGPNLISPIGKYKTIYYDTNNPKDAEVVDNGDQIFFVFIFTAMLIFVQIQGKKYLKKLLEEANKQQDENNKTV